MDSIQKLEFETGTWQ